MYVYFKHDANGFVLFINAQSKKRFNEVSKYLIFKRNQFFFQGAYKQERDESAHLRLRTRVNIYLKCRYKNGASRNSDNLKLRAKKKRVKNDNTKMTSVIKWRLSRVLNFN